MEAITKLYNLVKPLGTQIPIYKEVMTEDENSVPKSYILLKSDITDTGRFYGDGKAIIRSHDCDIHLISKGTSQNSNSTHNRNKKLIRSLLEEKGVDYIGVNVGFDDNQKTTEYVWSVTVYV